MFEVLLQIEVFCGLSTLFQQKGGIVLNYGGYMILWELAIKADLVVAEMPLGIVDSWPRV